MKNRKRISVLLVLAMVMTMLAGLAAPAAASAPAYTALATPSVPQTTAVRQTANLGTILISISALGAGSHAALFRLPTGVTLPVDLPDAMTTPAITPALTAGESISVAPVGDREFRLNLETTALKTDVKITVPILQVTTVGVSGDIECTITHLAGQLLSGSVVVGRAPGGQVSVSMVSVPTMGSASEEVEINVRENIPGALAVDDNSLEFALPTGFAWSLGATITNIATGLAPATITVAPVPGDTRRLRVDRNAGALPSQILRITATITPDEALARVGDVTATIGGASTANVGSLLVARFAEFGVSVSARTVETVLAGRADEEIGDFLVREAVPGSLTAGRNITVRLPDNAHWDVLPTVVVERGNVDLGPLAWVDDRTIRVPINVISGDVSDILFRDGRVELAADTTGPLNVEFTGQSGATGTLKVADIVAPVTVSAVAPNVIIGQKNQAGGAFTIVEGTKGAIDRIGILTVAAPNGVSFARTPTVRVTAGDLRIDNVNVVGSELRIAVRSDSTAASTIAVSDVSLTVDRTVPVGPVVFEVDGNAINKTSLAFPAADVVAKVTLAEVITPAPVDVRKVSVFTIGALSFLRDGVSTPIDAAPIIRDGRTLLPLRFAALAVGVSEDDIIWDNVRRTVTLFRGDRVVQLRIGDTNMTINGVIVPMEVAAAIEGARTVLPIRAVATALRANVVWDGTARTVTVTAQ